MSKTNDLRSLIVTKLREVEQFYTIQGIFYQVAQDDKMYPHIVYDLESANTLTDDRHRQDHKLVVDVYDRSTSAALVNDIADEVEGILHDSNDPQASILPTIYVSYRRNLIDEDKMIRHIQLSFTIQNYERN